MGVTFDELQGRRFVRDTLLETPPRMIPEIARNLRNTARQRPVEFARGMIFALEQVMPK